MAIVPITPIFLVFVSEIAFSDPGSITPTIGTLLSVLLKKNETQAKQEESNVTIDKSLQAAS